MARFMTITSQTALRPRRSGVRTSTCVTTPIRPATGSSWSARVPRPAARHHAIDVLTALVCAAAEHQVPVSAAVIASDRVGVAQLATRITSVLAHRCSHASEKDGRWCGARAGSLRELAAVDEFDRSSRLTMLSRGPVQVVDHGRERRDLPVPVDP